MDVRIITGYEAPDLNCMTLESVGAVCIISGTGNEDISRSSGGALTDDDFN